MADFRLPMSSGAETSSVSLDPRRQVAPAVAPAVDGGPAPTVRNSIETQFGAAQPAARSDGFAPTEKGNTQQGPSFVRDVSASVARDLEKKYALKKGVWKDINQKKDMQTAVKKKGWQTTAIKSQTEKKLAFRGKLDEISKKAVAQRGQIQQSIRAGETARAIRTDGVKVDVKVTDTRATDVQANTAVAEPAKKTQI